MVVARAEEPAKTRLIGKSFCIVLFCIGVVALLIVASTAWGGQSASSTPDRGANVRLAPFKAKGDGRIDDTAAIQAAIDASPRVYLPAGIYRIDPRIGLRVKTGTQIIGDGLQSTLLVAAPGGGDLRQLAGYGPGGIIRRAFDPNGKNDYVAYVRLADFGIILTHPGDAITKDAIQIGIDFRNVSRSSIERVHVGNTPPIGAGIQKASKHVFDSQGYGIVLGTVPSSIPSYSGGEMNTVRDVHVWGAYKGIDQDDEVLSPRSAAHGTVIERADIQGAQHLLSQESLYARAFVWRDNVLQNVIPQPGGNDQASVLRIEGRDAKVDGGYVEAGGLARYMIYLGVQTDNVSIDLLHVSCTNSVINVDRGSRNVIRAGDGCVMALRRN